MRPSRTAILTAALLAFGLTGCTQTIDGSASAATTPTVVTTSEPADESTDADAELTTTSESTTEEAEPVDEPTLVPPVDPTEDPFEEDTDDFDAPPTDLGTGIDGQSIAWLSAWCYGVGDIMTYAAPETTSMARDDTIETVVNAYVAMSEVAAGVGYQLEAMPQPTFLGAEQMSFAVVDWMFAVQSIYGTGAEQIASTDFASSTELMDAINDIEAGMAGPNTDLNDALGVVDPAVGDTLELLPECAVIVGE